MAKKKDTIYRETGVKSDIITLILENNGSVEESQIRKQLNKDPGNVNKHLHDLEEHGCIEIITGKKGFRDCNSCDINKIGHLKMIHEKLDKVPLNIYDKSLDLMEKKIGFDPNSLYARKFRIELIVSPAFFDMCLENNRETLNAKGHEMERLSEGFGKYELIDVSIDKVYTEYIKPISVNSGIWLNVSDLSTNNALKPHVDNNSMKRSLDFEIPKETFRKILEEMRVFGLMDPREEWSRRIFKELPSELLTISAEKISKLLEEFVEKIAQKIEELDEENFESIGNNRLAEEISTKISYVIFLELLKEIPEKFLDMPEENLKKILEDVFTEIFYGTYKKVMEIPNELFKDMAKIWWHQIESSVQIPDRIFNYCLNRDIDCEIVNPLAKEFVFKCKKLETSHKVKDPLCMCGDCSKLYVEFHEKCIEYCKKRREEARNQKKCNTPRKRRAGKVISQL